jgi:hypothetical protein
VASTGSQPQAWVASATTSAPCWRAAAVISAAGASWPDADWTRLNATSVVRPSMAPASRSSGTGTTSTPWAARTSQGNRLELNSPSGTTTRAPAVRTVATEPSSSETVAPMATSAAGTLTSRAKRSRDWSTLRSHGSQLVRPVRHSSSMAWTAANAGRGGRP